MTSRPKCQNPRTGCHHNTFPPRVSRLLASYSLFDRIRLTRDYTLLPNSNSIYQISSYSKSMADRVKEVASEEVERVKNLTAAAARSGAYLYPIRVSPPSLLHHSLADDFLGHLLLHLSQSPMETPRLEARPYLDPRSWCHDLHVRLHIPPTSGHHGLHPRAFGCHQRGSTCHERVIHALHYSQQDILDRGCSCRYL